MKRPVGFFLVLAGPKRNRTSYLRMACGLLRSMVERLPGLSCPIIVGHDGLPPDDKALLREIYAAIEFHRIDVKRYKEAGKANPRYYLLDAFNPKLNCQKIIVLGADMLCTGSTDALIYRQHGPIAMWWEPKRGCYNSGSMVLEGEVMRKEIHDELLACDQGDEFGHDQGIINKYFKGKIARLPDDTQRAVDDATVTPGSETWLHFWRKPFGAGDEWKQIHPDCLALLSKYMGDQAFKISEDGCE